MTSEAKDTVVPGLGVSPRYVLRTCGTEWGRKLIRPTLWVDIARRRIEKCRAEGSVIVVDDIRFEDELALIQELGGFTVRVVRPDAPDVGDHASEGRLEDRTFDYHVMNDGSLSLLREKADALAFAAYGWAP